MQNKLWIASKKAISFVDKLCVLSTVKSTTTSTLSTRNGLVVAADWVKNCTKSFRQKQKEFSSIKETVYPKQLKAKRNVPHKSTNSTNPTSYCIYNI
jgi:hypothetical protein